MQRLRVGLWLLGGLAICLSVGLSAPARAQVALKISVQKMSMKRRPTHAELKNVRALSGDVQTKVIDQQKMTLSFGTPKELLLPNGNRMILTAVSRNAERRLLKIRVKLMVHDFGNETEMSIPEGHGIPLPGGIYGKDLLMVNVTAQVQ